MLVTCLNANNREIKQANSNCRFTRVSYLIRSVLRIRSWWHFLRSMIAVIMTTKEGL